MKQKEYLKKIDDAYENLSGKELETSILNICNASGKEYGENSVIYASMLSEAGAYYRGQRKLEESEKYFLKALSILEKEDAFFSDIATGINNLAGTYRLMGRFEEAEELFRRCLDIYRTNLGDRHILYAAGLNNLGALYLNMGRLNEAAAEFAAASDILKDHSDALDEYATSLCNLGGLYVQKKMFAEAEKYLLEAKGLYETKLGCRTPHYHAVLNSLGLAEMGLGEKTKAVEMFTAAADACERLYGKNHDEYKWITAHLQMLRGKKG